jgi:hypothetical protein
MDEQHEGDKVLHQDAVEDVVREILDESGASVVGQGDHIRWGRGGGAGDATSSSFDYIADIQDQVGTTIMVDDEPAWADPSTGNWGWPTPVLTVDGIYTIVLTIDGGDAVEGKMLIVDADGHAIEPWTSPYQGVEFQGTDKVTAVLTAWFPADTHIDFMGMTATGTPSWALMIQHVG